MSIDLDSYEILSENGDNTSTESEMEDLSETAVTYHESDLNVSDIEAFDHMIKTSFSASISQNAIIMKALREICERFVEYIFNRRHNINDIRMKAMNTIASRAYGYSIDKINRSREERLCFEATCLLLFSRREYLSSHFVISESEFQEAYPQYGPSLVGYEEFINLFKFRNLMKMAMHLIPPLHNKNHLLDLVTRLVEGKEVRHVTGTGATKATRARVEIILREGNLIVPKRPPRINYTSSASSSKKKSSSMRKKLVKRSTAGSTQPPSSEVKRKRGRPRKDSVSSDETEVYIPRPTVRSAPTLADPFNLESVTKKPRVETTKQSPSQAQTEVMEEPTFFPASYFFDSYGPNAATHSSNHENDTHNSVSSNIDILIPPSDLMRSQSLEWFMNVLGSDSSNEVPSFHPDLFRGTSWFQGPGEFNISQT